MWKIQPVVTRYKNATRKGKTYDALSIQSENDNGTEILGKSDISKESKTKKETREKHVWLSGRMHVCMYVRSHL